MAQQVKVPAPEPDDLSSTPGTHSVGRVRTPGSCPLTSMCLTWHICSHAQTQSAQNMHLEV